MLDPSGAAIAGARVAAADRLSVVRETSTDSSGAFRLALPDGFRGKLIVVVSGFETQKIDVHEQPSEALRISLDLASQSDSLTVTGSAFETPLSEQGSSISVIPRAEIERRNEAHAIDLIREAPGVAVSGLFVLLAALTTHSYYKAYKILRITGGAPV